MPKKLDAFIKLSTLNNWGLAEQSVLEVGAFSAGTAFRAGEPPSCFVASCLFE